MTIIDIVLGAGLAFGFYKGLKNGLFVELASLISFFVGLFIAIKCSSFVGDFFANHFSWAAKTSQVLAFIFILIAVIVAVHLLAKIFTSIFSFAYLGWMNSLAGGFFASIKTILLMGIVLSLFQKVNIDNMIVSKETQESSILFNPCIKTSEVLLPILTDWFADLRKKVTTDDSQNTTPSTP